MDPSGIREVIERMYPGNSREEKDAIIKTLFPGLFLFEKRSELAYLSDDDFVVWMEEHDPGVIAAIGIPLHEAVSVLAYGDYCP